MRSLSNSIWSLLFVAVIGCGTDDGGQTLADGRTRVSLIDNLAWAPTADSDDPFWAEAAANADVCGFNVTEIEPEFSGIWFTVETSTCNYLTAQQPLTTAIPAGAEVEVRIWHFQITKGEGGYHLAITIGDDNVLAWDTQVPVPMTSALIKGQWIADRDYEAGERVLWHVSNHGVNSWSKVELNATY